MNLSRNELEKMYATIFDEHGNIKVDVEIESILNFCKILYSLTGVQACTPNGELYAYYDKLYFSALNILEECD